MGSIRFLKILVAGVLTSFFICVAGYGVYFVLNPRGLALEQVLTVGLVASGVSAAWCLGFAAYSAYVLYWRVRRRVRVANS